MTYTDDNDMDKAWWQAAIKVGVPAALLVFLIVWLVGDFNVRLSAMQDQHAQMLQVSKRMTEAQERSSFGSERVLRVLQKMCINDAKTKDARDWCLRD